MCKLIKVVVVKEYWYEGKHYLNGEYHFLPIETLNLIGMEHFIIIKTLSAPPKDKMIRASIQK